MSGLFQKEKYKHLKDKDGITMEKAFSLCALDYNSIDQASRGNEELKAFFELHIEQGPVLINNNKKIGIVTGIAAPVRLRIQISGKASHSGTTPMNMRKAGTTFMAPFKISITPRVATVPNSCSSLAAFSSASAISEAPRKASFHGNHFGGTCPIIG